MSLRLSDLWAPAWSVTLGGETFRMRPLSLGTFAELESEGLGLSSLSRLVHYEQWAKLFALLAELDHHDEQVIKRLVRGILLDPVGFEKFQRTIEESLTYKNESRVQINRRTVKNPLEALKKEQRVKQGMREDEAETEPLDATSILLAARLSGLSLADISRMSFRGLLALQDWLKENPPQPAGLGLLAGLF